MVKFSLCNELFEREGWRRSIELAAEAGYDGVEIAPYTIAPSVEQISPSQREEIRKVAEDAGIEVVGLHWVLVGPEGVNLLDPDPAVRGRTRDYLLKLVDFCADIGGRVIVFGSPKQRNIPEGVDKEVGWRWAVESFRAVAEHAGERGVVFCIEPLRRELTNFINTCSEALRLIEEVSHPNFRLVLDCWSMLDEGRPLPEIVKEGARYLAHFHANDDNKRAPGFGSLDFARVLRALDEIDYNGFVSVEVFDVHTDPLEIARSSLSVLRGAWEGCI